MSSRDRTKAGHRLVKRIQRYMAGSSKLSLKSSTRTQRYYPYAKVLVQVFMMGQTSFVLGPPCKHQTLYAYSTRGPVHVIGVLSVDSFTARKKGLAGWL